MNSDDLKMKASEKALEKTSAETLQKVQSSVLRRLNERRFIKDCSNISGLDELLSKEKITLYCGFDLTAESLHVGSLMILMLLRVFLRESHNVVVLLGGATTKIGDPTGKDATRKILTEDEIEKNRLGILRDINSILGGENVAEIGRENDGESKSGKLTVLNNDDWLSGFGYVDFLRDVGVHFSVNRMLAMDSVKSRLDRQGSMSFVEFNYILMQSYDFCHLAKSSGCRLQVGGSDQWGNIVNGIELSGRMGAENEVFGLTCPLLTRSDGGKMGKSEKGAVWLSLELLSSFEYFQYFRNIADLDIENMLFYYTDISVERIGELVKLKGQELNEAKEILAFEATKICRGEEEAESALRASKDAFAEDVITDNLQTINIEVGASVAVVCLKTDSSMTRTEIKKLIAQNAVRVDGVVCDMQYIFLEKRSYKLSLGKKRHYCVKVS